MGLQALGQRQVEETAGAANALQAIICKAQDILSQAFDDRCVSLSEQHQFPSTPLIPMSSFAESLLHCART